MPKAAVKNTLKDVVAEQAIKRSRSSSLVVANGAQRMPLGPGKTESAANAPRHSTARIPKPSVFKRLSRQETAVPVVLSTEEDKENDMDIELPDIKNQDAATELSIISEKEVDDVADVQETDADLVSEEIEAEPKSARMWPDVDTQRAMRHYRQVSEVQEVFEDEVDVYDTTMVSEYSEEIFRYMSELEVGHSFFFPA